MYRTLKIFFSFTLLLIMASACQTVTNTPESEILVEQDHVIETESSLCEGSPMRFQHELFYAIDAQKDGDLLFIGGSADTEVGEIVYGFCPLKQLQAYPDRIPLFVITAVAEEYVLVQMLESTTFIEIHHLHEHK